MSFLCMSEIPCTAGLNVALLLDFCLYMWYTCPVFIQTAAAN